MVQQGLQDQGSCWAWAAGHAEPFATVESVWPRSPALALLARNPAPSLEDLDPMLAMLHQQAGPFLADARQHTAGPHPSAAGGGGACWPDSPEAAYSLPERPDASAAGSTLLRAYAGSWLGLKLLPGDAGQSLCRAAQLQTLQGGAAKCTESKLPLQMGSCLLQLPDDQVPLASLVYTACCPKRLSGTGSSSYLAAAPAVLGVPDQSWPSKLSTRARSSCAGMLHLGVLVRPHAVQLREPDRPGLSSITEEVLAESMLQSPPSSFADEAALLLVAHCQLKASTATQTGTGWCLSVQACWMIVAAPSQVHNSKAACCGKGDYADKSHAAC